MRHRGGNRRSQLMAGAAFAVAMAAAGVASAEPINIAPQSLTSALNEFGHQTNFSVVFTPDLTASKASQGVANSSDPEAALQQILSGTGLTFQRSGDAFLIARADGSAQLAQTEGGGSDVDALIVTAQKKEEQIQDVPIAISAFTQKSLDAQKLEGGFDLLKAIPNVTFSKSNFTGYNFSIRGIGTKAVSASTDPGVAVSFNNATLIVNRLFEQEYVDVERVEELRGPQGTLFGRNATSGVINVISAKPRMDEFLGEIKLEGGNFNAQRVRAHVNVPLGDAFAVRAAFAMTKRDGYGFNEASLDPGSDIEADVDDRDLWTGRLSLGWEPIEAIRANLVWEHFEEDDQRVRTSKQLCHHDAGPEVIAGLTLTDDQRSLFTQGCVGGSLYDTGTATDPSDPAGAAHGAFGTPHGAALPFFQALLPFNPLVMTFGNSPYFGNPAAAPCPRAAIYPQILALNACSTDPYGSLGQSRDLRSIYSAVEPAYWAKSDVIDLTFDIDLTDSVTLTSQTVYARDEVYSTQDFNRFTTVPIFSDTTGLNNGQIPGSYLAGGVFDDPQLGPSDSILGQDISQSKSWQFNQEFRVASNFDGPVNFSLGANYTRFDTVNDYYAFFNLLNLVALSAPFSIAPDGCDDPADFAPGNTPTFQRGSFTLRCSFYVDRNPLESIDGQGHNYFRSQNPYRLSSGALFGELYWQVTDTVKVTAGARMTWDRKTFTLVPSQTLLGDYRTVSHPAIPIPPGAGPEACYALTYCQTMGTAINGYGYPAQADIVQEWTEPTGRLVVDWKPETGFTDETMVYLSLAHGYKGGGANPPGIAWPNGMFIAEAQEATSPPVFEPEFVDALELGTKNTLLGGSLVLNGALFFYDYTGYQVSKIVDRSAANENFDSKVWGAELEWVWSPTRSLRFNGAFGALRTEIADGEQSIDLMDRTQGGNVSWTSPDGRTFDEWIVIKPWLTQSSNCIAPAELVAVALQNNGTSFHFCPGGNWGGNSYWFNPDDPNAGLGGVPGFATPTYTTAPNGGAGFFADLSGHELPNAPHWTASLGAQYSLPLPGGWDATLRGDFYWQSQSYARVYNTQYDKLRAWTNTNISLWVENPEWGSPPRFTSRTSSTRRRSPTPS